MKSEQLREWINIFENDGTIQEDGERFEYHIGGMRYDMGVVGSAEELSLRAIRSSQEVVITTESGEFVALYRGGELRLGNPKYSEQIASSKNPLPPVFKKANSSS